MRPTSSSATFTKARLDAPAGYFAWEAAGLRWLAEVTEGAPVVGVRNVAKQRLVLERLIPTAPSAEAAYAFGEGLARTHEAGAPAFGAPPTAWQGDGFLGPLTEPLPLALGTFSSWGQMWGQARIAPLVRLGRDRGRFGPEDAALFERVARRAVDGDFETPDRPARIHGDLWAGNVMWTASGAVLIDPAAHGGHPETDLAMMALFGFPHLSDVYAGYHDVRPLHPGWRERRDLHQLHPLLLHVVIFGGGYLDQTLAVARSAEHL